MTSSSSRLSDLKNLLHTTTHEAYQSIVPETNVSTTTTSTNNSETATTQDDDNANRAGLELGLHLFGTSAQYKEQLDREYMDKLESIEREVTEIRERLHAALDGRDVHSSNQDEEMEYMSTLNPAQLQNHIDFLRLCKSVQSTLDRIDTNLSFASDQVSLSSFSPSNLLLSPSSSNTVDGFTFDGRSKNNRGENAVATAAKLVMQIEGELNSVMGMLDASTAEEGDGVENDDDQLHKVQEAIYNELRFQFRRKKMELRHRAISTLEGCILVNSNKLLVRGANNTDGKAKKTVNFGDLDPATPREIDASSLTPSPLGDAYAILEAFNNDQYPVFGETLDRAMKTIGKQLLDQVFEPALRELDMSDDDSIVGYYKFTQETVKNSGGGRKYGSVAFKGWAVQLMWEMNKMDYVSKFTGRDSTIISTTAAITDADLAASSPLASVGTFLSCLNFVLHVLEFVHDHVLLKRTDLAKLLGQYLLGTYPIPTSLSSGSATLGGVLVGFAALGEESGEVRPLMVRLIKCMRKWCIPDESNVDIWSSVPKIQRVLIREIAAFEDRLVDMGYMNTKGDCQKFTAASSPSGLSVLVNQDDIGSPIDVNMTMNRDSPMEVSSPPTDQSNPEDAVRSSLSEIAHSFLQAYSENQRSKILSRGRGILDNTDYHNSVQVGKFVPPPSEPGTLEHLDEDPMDAFVFHQCSISTTAQKTLQLVRQTLDEAIRPEMARELDSLPPVLYRASREVLDLFRAVIPRLYASEIGSIPRMAAILHNDCVYLSHEVSLLGAEYKSKFKSDNESSKTHLLSKVCTFVDMVPPFRDLANKSMGDMLEIQKRQLFELISPRLVSFKQALSSNESVSEWDDAETALRAALYHLRHLSQSWSQVLSCEVYHLAVGNLVDTIFSLLLDPILSAEAITDAASRFVHSLLLDAARECSSMFVVGNSTMNLTLNADNANKHIKLAQKYSMLLEKLQCVGQFMVMCLDDISRGLEEGLFRSMTGKELSHIITSTYDESAKRNALLKALASK